MASLKGYGSQKLGILTAQWPTAKIRGIAAIEKGGGVVYTVCGTAACGAGIPRPDG